MDTYVSSSSTSERPLELVDNVPAEQVGELHEVPADHVGAKEVSPTPTKRRRRKRKDWRSPDKQTTGFEIQPPPVEPCTKQPRRVQKPNVRLSDYWVGSVMVVAMMANADIEIPNSYKQARASKYWPQWRAATLAELASLKKHKTWKLAPRAAAKKSKVIACRWVFAVKRDERGRIKRFKAILVIHGFKQQLGINYSETYAPVIRFETIRAVIYFALQRGCEVLQFDVKTAFLYGDLQCLSLWSSRRDSKTTTMTLFVNF
ncbi:hypothetical protein PR003_g1564 [Phytophthora rubi]|uniref:Reverse transcriptase Ty1/copia-type domain-containing protein n=1 Tax=Phytophthora rubi TaxID=129364 RepID=A0A6A3NSS3_9STRA|nr:hypothetical protein PR001_g5771 [Phytophthora rubi]KAE9357899.1 hypothetical protein PR003_g1564 [Phytophthora rubi]